ncbi:MAG TPA: GerW family sporulation protein [Candidatus Avilachnospira avicola]|nr:GerW family sporulation protein [Candidatus Avilachnospira avicola]
MKEKSIKQAVNSFDAEVSLKDDGIGITIDALFKGLEGIASSKTVIGEPICLDDVKLIPLIEVTAGLASGALARNARQNGAGAMSAKVTPIALLILQNGRLKLVNVKNQDIWNRLLDMIPDAVDKITGNIIPRRTEEEAKERLNDMGVEIISPESPEDKDE